MGNKGELKNGKFIILYFASVCDYVWIRTFGSDCSLAYYLLCNEREKSKKNHWKYMDKGFMVRRIERATRGEKPTVEERAIKYEKTKFPERKPK